MTGSTRPSPEYLHRKFICDAEAGEIRHRAGPMQGRPAFTAYSDGYLRGRVDAQLFSAHLIIWAMTYGYWPQERGLTIDHINGDRADNRLSNLRCVPQSLNQRNKAMPRSNTSGVMGVYNYPEGKWTARIRVNGKHIVLGSFREKEHAVIARRAAERALGFSGRHGQEPGRAND